MGPSLQMMSWPLIDDSSFKTLPRFHFIVAKTGCNPMKTVLQLFLKWGIKSAASIVWMQKADREVKYSGIK
jgi:type IV secretion system protein VirD4